MGPVLTTISPANHQHHLGEGPLFLGMEPAYYFLHLTCLCSQKRTTPPLARLAPSQLAFLKDSTQAILRSLAWVISFPLSLTFCQA